MVTTTREVNVDPPDPIPSGTWRGILLRNRKPPGRRQIVRGAFMTRGQRSATTPTGDLMITPTHLVESDRSGSLH
jgi:hypothetical protein